MNFQEFLKRECACREVLAWVEDKTAQQAWKQCPRADWMLWLVSQIVYEQELKQEIVQAAADITRTTLVRTTDQRVHACLADVDRWLAGEQVDLRAAASGAFEAAARAAEDAEDAEATEVARAVTHAAFAAAWAADIVRKHLPWNRIQPLLARAMRGPRMSSEVVHLRVVRFRTPDNAPTCAISPAPTGTCVFYGASITDEVCLLPGPCHNQKLQRGNGTLGKGLGYLIPHAKCALWDERVADARALLADILLQTQELSHEI